MKYIFWTILGYISGSILYSHLLTKFLKKIDIVKDSTDHNPGAANVIKTAGTGLGFLCMVLDVMKGFIPVSFALQFCSINEFFIIPVIISPVLGHAFSPFLKFKGGKSIAVSFGALLALLPYKPYVFFLAAILFFFTFVLAINPPKLRVIFSFTLFGISLAILEETTAVLVSAIAIAILVVFKHLPYREENKAEVAFLNRPLLKRFHEE